MISLSSELEAMKAEAAPGKCICCDGPLPPRPARGGRPRVICTEPECRKLYHAIHALGRARSSGTLLRRVVERRRVRHQDKPAVRLTLECGHSVTVKPCRDRGDRRYCTECASGRLIRWH